MQYPKKSEQVYAELIGQELCLFDAGQQKMHTLNPTAALVWQQCDGQTAPAQMAARLEQELNVPEADRLVWLSLDRLGKAGLLQTKVNPPLNRAVYTRRELLKRAGITLALLPVIKSIVLPSAAEAQCSANCVFPVFWNESPCASLCEEFLLPDEVLCSSELVDNLFCACHTINPDPNPEDCPGPEPINGESSSVRRRRRK